MPEITKTSIWPMFRMISFPIFVIICVVTIFGILFGGLYDVERQEQRKYAYPRTYHIEFTVVVVRLLDETDFINSSQTIMRSIEHNLYFTMTLDFGKYAGMIGDTLQAQIVYTRYAPDTDTVMPPYSKLDVMKSYPFNHSRLRIWRN